MPDVLYEGERWLKILRVTPWLRLVAAAIGAVAAALAAAWWDHPLSLGLAFHRPSGDAQAVLLCGVLYPEREIVGEAPAHYNVE